MKGDIFAIESLLEDFYDLETGKPLPSNTDGFLKKEIKQYMEAKKEYESPEDKGYSVEK